jgi:Raf kinase inhibitor-like YbhB/YbcL family protein
MACTASTNRPDLKTICCALGLAAGGTAWADVRPSIDVSSTAFAANAMIPAEFTCDGANQSPPLKWTAPPQATRSFALIVEDPDAPSGIFRHWGLYNLSPDRRQLARGEGNREAAGMSEARDDFGKIGYSGPCPPRGHGPHHYHFRLLALDVARLSVPAHPSAAQLLQAAEPHIVATGVLTARYERQ